MRAVMIGVPRWCHSGCAYLQPQHLQDQGTENTPDNTDKQLKQYFRYEQGFRDIPTDILISLSDLYDVSIDYLLGRTDNPLILR